MLENRIVRLLPIREVARASLPLERSTIPSFNVLKISE